MDLYDELLKEIDKFSLRAIPAIQIIYVCI